MAIITAPFMPLFAKPTIRNKPTAAKIAGIEVISPKVNKVAGLSTTIPAFFRAINARKSPMPAAIPKRNECGILFIIHSRILNKLNTIKISPEKNTPPNATCQV